MYPSGTRHIPLRSGPSGSRHVAKSPYILPAMITTQDDINPHSPLNLIHFIMPHRRALPSTASTDQIQTTHDHQALERSASFSEALNERPSLFAERESENQVKATLTGLLNDRRVKSSPDNSRRVQEALIRTEQELREQRRRSCQRDRRRKSSCIIPE